MFYKYGVISLIGKATVCDTVRCRFKSDIAPQRKVGRAVMQRIANPSLMKVGAWVRFPHLPPSFNGKS